MISCLLHWFVSRTLIGNWPSVPSSSSSSCSVLPMTLWCAGMLKVLLRMDFLRFTREYMSMFSWKRRALMPTLAFTLHHQAVVLFKPWFAWRSTASLTSSVSPVHMRRRSTSRFCLMLLMLSISWRTASAVLHTRKPTQNEKQVNNFV